MKKYLSIVCAIAMLASLTGCGSSGSSSKSLSKSSVTSDEKKNDTISIKNYRLSTDSKNNPVLIVDYEFRNNTDEAKSFSSLFYDKAFQNGVKCKGITLIGSKDFDSSANDTEILPGYTYTVNQAYYITDNSDVLIMVTDYFNKTTYLEQTISLENLQIETTTEKATEEATEAPTEKPTEKITEPVTEPEPETEPATEAQVEVSLPQSTGDYVDYIGSQIDITDKSLMAAQMIGAEEGTSFKYNGNKFEIYRFKDGDPKLEEAASGSIMLSIEGFGEYESSASVNNNFIMIYNTPDDTVISAFNSLK